eukprot:jgi/Bigna1/137310/aug1.38_g12018
MSAGQGKQFNPQPARLRTARGRCRVAQKSQGRGSRCYCSPGKRRAASAAEGLEAPRRGAAYSRRKAQFCRLRRSVDDPTLDSKFQPITPTTANDDVDVDVSLAPTSPLDSDAMGRYSFAQDPPNIPEADKLLGSNGGALDALSHVASEPRVIFSHSNGVSPEDLFYGGDAGKRVFARVFLEQRITPLTISVLNNQAEQSMASPGDIVSSYFECWNRRDMEAAIALFDENNLRYEDTLYPKVFTEKEQLKRHLLGIAAVLPGNFEFILDDLSVASPNEAGVSHVGVQWHVGLSDGVELPFTRGCSIMTSHLTHRPNMHGGYGGVSFYKVSAEGKIIYGFDVPEPVAKTGDITIAILRLVRFFLFKPFHVRFKTLKKTGHGYNIDTNRLVKIGGRTYKKLNVKGSPFEVVNSSLNSFRNLNESQLKKTHRTICGGTNTSCAIFVHRKVDEERKHAINEFNHEGLRLANVMTINGVVLKKTTQAFRNAIGRFVKIKSKLFDRQICGVLMRNQNMAEEMNNPSFEHSDHIKIIHNGSYDSKSSSNYDVSQIVVKDNNNNVAMNCKYLECEINDEAKTFGELFHQPKKHYRENSCMFNAVVNSHEKSFEKSRHENITHDALCNIVGKKEKKKEKCHYISKD